MNNLAPKPAAPERTLSVPVDRGQDHRRIRPGMLDVARVTGTADEHFALSLKTLSMRTLAHTVGVRRDSVLVDRGKEVRLEISEHATIELTREQSLRLVADLARALGLREGALQVPATAPPTVPSPDPAAQPPASEAAPAPAGVPSRSLGHSPAVPPSAAGDADPPQGLPVTAFASGPGGEPAPGVAAPAPGAPTAAAPAATVAQPAFEPPPRRFGKRLPEPGAAPAAPLAPQAFEPVLAERPRRRPGRAAMLGMIAAPVAVVPLASAWVVAAFLMGQDVDQRPAPAASRAIPTPATSEAPVALAATEAAEAQRAGATGSDAAAEPLPRSLFEPPRSALPRIAWDAPAPSRGPAEAAGSDGPAATDAANRVVLASGPLPSTALLLEAARPEGPAFRPIDRIEGGAATRTSPSTSSTDPAARGVTPAPAAITAGPGATVPARADRPVETPAPVVEAPATERAPALPAASDRVSDTFPVAARPVVVEPASAGSAAGVVPAPDSAAPGLAVVVSAAPARAPATGVVVRARADTWLQVRDGRGEVLISRVLRAGEEWSAPRVPGLRLTTGNAGGTEVEVNGTVLPPLGPSGVVRRDMLLNGQ